MTRHLLIMAGGTGGHIFPGQALGHEMQNQGWHVSWLGAQGGLEDKLVPQAGFKLHKLAVQGLRGKGWAGLMLAPWRLTYAVLQAWRLLRRLRPDVVIGFGGYASGPGGIAAWLLGIPLIIHEQNAIPGLTNRWLAKLANTILQAFPHTFKSHRALTVGNPIRQPLLNVAAPQQRLVTKQRPWRLLVLGGSRGAMVLNQTLPISLSLLPAELRPEVWHQTGEQHVSTTQQQYAAQGIAAKIQPFIDEMAHALAWADLVICRAGALTVSELATVGVASILVPYPYAVDDHQTANAKFLTEAQAAVLIAQQDLTPQRLAEVCQALLAKPQAFVTMAQAAYERRVADTIMHIKQQCLNLIEDSHDKPKSKPSS